MSADAMNYGLKRKSFKILLQRHKKKKGNRSFPSDTSAITLITKDSHQSRYVFLTDMLHWLANKKLYGPVI